MPARDAAGRFVRITDTDKGYSKLVDAIREAGKGAELTVGLHAEDADGSMMEAAEINEFGSPGGMIPARPAISGWADENATWAKDEIADEMRAALEAKRNPIARLDAMAQQWAGEIQANIAEGIQPDNAASTIAKKGSSTPLVDSGQFRSSIAGRVRPK